MPKEIFELPGRDINNEPLYWAQEDAPREAVDFMLKQPIEDSKTHDGRSRWLWIRLPNGDLILGFYPQGDAYFTTEQWRTI